MLYINQNADMILGSRYYVGTVRDWFWAFWSM